MKTIIGIGEAVWDVFPDARRAGGSPANVAFHVQKLGHRGRVVSRVGLDEDGDELVAWFAGKGLDTDFIQRDVQKPTGTVPILLVDGEPQFTITEDVAWDYLALTDELRAVLPQTDAICLGTLAQRSPVTSSTIKAVLRELPASCLRVLDLNMRPPYWTSELVMHVLPLADVIKLNQTEKAALEEMAGVSDAHDWLLEQFGITYICQTYGRDGAALRTRNGYWRVVGEPVDTSNGDAVGVGDAFLAALIHGLLRSETSENTLQFANRYAAQVAMHRGAMPDF